MGTKNTNVQHENTYKNDRKPAQSIVTLYFASARWVLEETLGMARTKGEEDREAKREAVTGEPGGIHILALGQMEIGEDQRRRGQ